MEDSKILENDPQNGLAVKALDAITNAYKVGGYLLAAMITGTVLMVASALLDQGTSMMMVTGSVLLCLCMALVTFLYVKPFRDLKRKLDEKSEFLKVSQDGVVRMAGTVRDFSGGIAENHESVASALKAVRPYLDSVPLVANWIDSAQDLSADLIKHAIALRDASNSIEVAFSTGDAHRLRQSLDEAQKLAEQIKMAAGSKRLIRRLDLASEQLEELGQSDALQQLNAALQIAVRLLKRMPAMPANADASLDVRLAGVAKALGDAGVGDILASLLRRSGVESKSS